MTINLIAAICGSVSPELALLAMSMYNMTIARRAVSREHLASVPEINPTVS